MGMLSEKVAFVTGGGSGIGRGIAERLAREGADVSIADIDLPGAEETAALVRQAGYTAHVVNRMMPPSPPRSLALTATRKPCGHAT